MIKLKYLLFESVTDSPQFKKWFGNSKVVDENGLPLIVYHGGRTKFTIFDPSKTSVRTDLGRYGLAVSYFTPEKHIAARYGSELYAVYLSIQNPLVINDGKTYYDVISNLGIVDKDEEKRFQDQLNLLDKIEKLSSSKRHEIYKRIAYKMDLKIADRLKKSGYDGIYEPSANYWGGKRPTWAVWNSRQIKMADNNEGHFDINDPDITKESTWFMGQKEHI